MKTKLNLAITLALLMLISVVIYSIKPKTPINSTPKLAMNFIKCTPAKFLLEDIDTTKQISPLFENLGDLNLSISTNNKEAQIFFNQGIKLTYAFNHAEAHRSFMEASRLDPSSAMSYWGQAYVLGPNINDPLPDAQRRLKSYEAIERAKSLLENASQKERDMIEAFAHRTSKDSVDIKQLNMAYMKAMMKVAEKYPQDADIQTLFAASAMNTMPWAYWDKQGNPSTFTPAAKIALEKAMNINPNHPGAHHYYIHMVELPFPDLAIPSADKLGSLMPAAGHIVHMPSHVYIRVGRYKDAVKVNQAAILADEDYISQCYSQGMYPLGYYPHNIHFLWSAATLLGDSKLAIDAAKKTAEKVPAGELKDMPFLQNFASVPLLAYTRFGKWNEILTIPKPKDDIKHLKLIWHYARGIAFLRKNNIYDAQEELDAIEDLRKDPELELIIAAGFDNSLSIANVAVEVLAGEIAAAKGDRSMAIEHLKKAVLLEDLLVYTEPAAWYIPTRQTLGLLLLNAGKYEEAESVYKQDLANLRQNGWSLMGLLNSLELQGKVKEAMAIKKEFDIAWKDADFKLETSVL